MSNDVPHWSEDATLKWAPERPFAPTTQRIGPWSPPAETAKEKSTTAPLWPWRLAIGLLQGLGFWLLLQARQAGAWPASDPFLFDAIALPLALVPLLALDGLGTVRTRWLLAFTAIAALLLAALGWYHRWQIAGVTQSHTGLSLLTLCAIALFIAQSFVRAGPRFSYDALFAAAWTLAARLMVLLLALGAGIALIQSPIAPRLHLAEGSFLAPPLLGVLSALAFQITAAWPRFTIALRDALIASLTIALPLACAAALLLISATLGQTSRPLILLLGVMVMLTMGVNASYRGGIAGALPRRAWRDACEVFGALLLLVLAGVAAYALQQRVAHLGWTPARLFAGVAVAFFLAYGLCYSIAALAGLFGKSWMAGLERSNIVLGLTLLLVCLALASPLADPLRLAAAAQAARLESGAVTIEAFDFANLAHDRFGLAQLEEMTRGPYRDIARAATLSRQALPASPAPNPTEIGANIAVRSLGGSLPAALLARDWRNVADVPACLTHASEACDAYFMDLDSDSGDEILLVSGSETRWWGAVMKADAAGRWFLAGRIAAPACGPSLSDLRAGRYALVPPRPGFRDMAVAGIRLTVVPAALGCPRQP